MARIVGVVQGVNADRIALVGTNDAWLGTKVPRDSVVAFEGHQTQYGVINDGPVVIVDPATPLTDINGNELPTYIPARNVQEASWREGADLLVQGQELYRQAQIDAANADAWREASYAKMAAAQATASGEPLSPAPQPTTVQGKVAMATMQPVILNTSPSFLGDLGGIVLGGLGGAITGGIPGAIGGIGTAISGILGGGAPSVGGSSGNAFAGSQTGYGSCAPGYVLQNGNCVKPGILGTIQGILPGGQTGTQADVYGQATVGAWGMPALVPSQRQILSNKCPPGAVLGKDGLCYNRGAIPNKMRKWPRAPKPLLSAADAKVLNRAHSLEHKLNRVAGRFLAPAKPTRRKKGRGRARK